MKLILKRILGRVAPRLSMSLRVNSRLVRWKASYLHSTGWIRSLEEGRPVDHDGNPIPWMNYPVIRFLEDRLRSDFNLFEYGSGNSTSFFAARVRFVTSVEYDRAWLELVESKLPTNAKLVFQSADVDGAYCRTITVSGEKYDVVIIDGRDRVNCVRQAVHCLSSRGVILLDDSQRARYADGLSYGNEEDRSTIFYRRDNCFGI